MSKLTGDWTPDEATLAGANLTRFMAWLDRLIASGEVDGVDEGTLADQLEAFRHEQENYVEPSFDTISALGPNAAMCHYRHTNGTPRAFGQDSIYLVDSGAQYLDGTTDITRTVTVAPVTLFPAPSTMVTRRSVGDPVELTTASTSAFTDRLRVPVPPLL